MIEEHVNRPKERVFIASMKKKERLLRFASTASDYCQYELLQVYNRAFLLKIVSIWPILNLTKLWTYLI